MARPTHIAVNLLLIVAVTMQPSLAYGLQQDCSDRVSTGYKCQGCGCCKVQSETVKCPCCSGEATKDDGSCCGHAEEEHHAATFADDPFDGMELQEGPDPQASLLGHPKQTSCESAAQVKATDLAAIAAACNCIMAPEPFNAPVPGSPATELRDVLTLSIVCVVDVATSVQPPRSGSCEYARGPVEPHFSQIAFCVWRL